MERQLAFDIMHAAIMALRLMPLTRSYRGLPVVLRTFLLLLLRLCGLDAQGVIEVGEIVKEPHLEGQWARAQAAGLCQTKV